MLQEIAVKARRWKVDATRNGQFWNNVNSGAWEAETYDALSVLLQAESTFVDVGTWIGPLTLFASQICCKIIGFECDPVALDEIDRNLSLNPNIQAKVLLNKFALGDGAGTLKICSRELGNSETTIFARAERDGAIIDMPDVCEVQIKDARQELGSIVKNLKQNDLVKIDIEGSEYKVIPRISEMIAEAHCTWIISLHEDNIIRNPHPSRAIRMAETVRLLDCFVDYGWYNMNFDELDKEQIYDDIFHDNWLYGQTLVFSRRKLKTINSDATPAERKRPQGFVPLAAPGGRVGQALVKASNRDGDVDWAEAGLSSWRSFEPVVEARVGSIGSYLSRGRMQIVGKTVSFTSVIEILESGNGEQSIDLFVPFGIPAAATAITGIEDVKTGNAIVGTIHSGVDKIAVKFYNNNYPGITGYRLIIGGIYEIK